VETENLGPGEGRKTLGILDVTLVITMLRCVVNSGRTELVVIIINLFGEVLAHKHHQCAPVELFSHTTSIIAFSDEVLQRSNRNLVGVFVNENRELLDRNTKISFVETVLNVPSKGAVKATLLNNSVEEAKTEKEFAELLRGRGSSEEGRVGDGIHKERVAHIRAETFGSFVSHLDTILKHSYGESSSGVRSEPETEVTVICVGGTHVFGELFESTHPADSQMAVLKNNPITSFLSFSNSSFSLDTLALTK